MDLPVLSCKLLSNPCSVDITLWFHYSTIYRYAVMWVSVHYVRVMAQYTSISFKCR